MKSREGDDEASGIIILAEIARDLFELHVATPDLAHEGMAFRARVRAVHPLSHHPARGVRLEGVVKLDDEDETVLRAGGVTDGDGFATIDFEIPRNVDAEEAEVAVTGALGSYARTVEDSVTFYHMADVVVSTDKPIYQPGQTLRVRAILRDPLARRALDGAEATLRIRDPEGAHVYKAKLRASRFGVVSAEWPIGEDTRLGDYFVEVELEDGSYADSVAGQSVRISRYDLPTFAVSVAPDRKFYLPGENAEVVVSGDYLFGKPVPRGRVRIAREAEREWDFEKQKWHVEEEETYEGEADAEGRFTARIDLEDAHRKLAEQTGDNTRFLDVTYAAYYTDPLTNRTEQRRFDLRVTREPIHVYVMRSNFYFQPVGLPLEFYVSAFYADGTPARASVEVSEQASPLEVASATLPAGIRTGTVLGEATTNRFGLVKFGALHVEREKTASDDESRTYKFVARDGAGRTGSATETVELRESPGVRVETGKTIYRPGESIRAVITSNQTDATLTVEAVRRERAFHTRTVRLRDGRAEVQLPYTPEFRGEVRIVAYTMHADSSDVVGGGRAVLFPAREELSMEVKFDKDEYRPGEQARAEFRVRDSEGRAVESALGVVVTDRAVEERARTDREFGANSGAGGFSDYARARLGEGDSLAGVSRRELNRLDARAPLSADLDLLAEVLINRDSRLSLNVFGNDISSDQRELFASFFDEQFKPLRAALAAHYKERAEHPQDEAELRRMLAGHGIDLASLRDPFGRPYRLRFHVERENHVLSLTSDAADKRHGTADDFEAFSERWPYFRRTGESFERASKNYFSRTGRTVPDRAALGEELSREGVDLETLRDPWGQPYDLHFDINGREHRIEVRSSGPDRRFSRERSGASDDFAVWTVRLDYLKKTEAQINAALERYTAGGRDFPRDEESLRAALRESGLDESALRDPFGRAFILRFYSQPLATGRYIVRSYARFGESPKTATEMKPAKRTMYGVKLYGVGRDGAPETYDDVFLTHFVHVSHDDDAPDESSLHKQTRTLPTPAGGGELTGTVVDPNGAVIAGARVRYVNRASRESGETKTNEAGVFRFVLLASGAYDLTFEHPGFVPMTITEVPVNAAGITEVGAQLEPGAITETVNVASGALLLETTSASVSEVTALRVDGVWNSSLMKMNPGAAVNVVTRPGAIETPRVREHFPETLFWQPSLETDADGRASLSFTLADNITTWKVALIGSTLDGTLGLAETEVRAFQPFFVEHDPPRFLTVGDEISLPVVLHNFLERAEELKLEFGREDWYALLGPPVRSERVPAGASARSTLDFRALLPVEDGKQRVTALGREASDAIEKSVTVRHDGDEMKRTTSRIVNSAGDIEFDVPRESIPGSARALLKFYPDMMAHTFEAVEGIMQRPYGCGEQTISSTYPSVLVLRHYARRRVPANPANAPASLAARYARDGYRRLTNYQTGAGGFAYWNGGEPDLALTAYALSFLSDARDVVEIDEERIESARIWLLKQQRPDGAWWPRHAVNSGDERPNALRLTAYVARMLAASNARMASSNADAAKTSVEALTKAVSFLAPHVEKSDDPYLLASFLLANAGRDDSAETSGVARKLAALAHVEGERAFWRLRGSTPFHSWGEPANIETTALALRALKTAAPPSGPSARDDDATTERALFYLLDSKDGEGVWHTTQATVSALDALAVFPSFGEGAGANGAFEIFVNGRHLKTVNPPLDSGSGGPTTLDITPFVNAPGRNVVQIRSARGGAAVLAQVLTNYFVPWENSPDAQPDADRPRMRLVYDRTDSATGRAVSCSVSIERAAGGGGGMYIAEVGLPPGAEVDRASLELAAKRPDSHIDRYEVLPDRVLFYIWPRDVRPSKFEFRFAPRYPVRALAAPSEVYDYYNPSARAVVRPVAFVIR